MKVHKREKKKKESRQSLKNKNFRLKRGKKKTAPMIIRTSKLNMHCY